ncbi:MAG: THUMP-like domain-containing protein, partial [Dehalococcoidia bacterium]
PGRRADQHRIFDVRKYQPPLPLLLGLRDTIPALGIKVAPGIRDDDVPPDCEAEFIQYEGDLKQATLWPGALRTCARRASLLPGGETLVTGTPEPIAVTDPATVLYEPEPAVIRAHAVERLAHMLGATKLDETTAYLTAADRRPTPFARAFAVEEWMPFNLKALRRRLQALDVGAVVVKKRASPLDPRELEQALHLHGGGRRVLVLTRVRGRHSVLICREPQESSKRPQHWRLGGGDPADRVDSSVAET